MQNELIFLHFAHGLWHFSARSGPNEGYDINPECLDTLISPYLPYVIGQALANSVDPDEMQQNAVSLQNAASHQVNTVCH